MTHKAFFMRGVIGLLLVLPLLCAAQKKVENPWKALPVGTVLEFRIATDESESLHGQTKHQERTEVWTVVANDGKVATIEVAAGDTAKGEVAVKMRMQRDLQPVDALPEPAAATDGDTRPTAMGAPDGEDRSTVVYDRIETLFGAFDGVRIDHLKVMLESESRSSEWRAPGFPEPLKVVKLSAGGNGMVRSTTETRTLVRFDVPGSSWRDYALGASFDVQVESQHRKLYPPGQQPTTETSMEHWKLVKKDDQTATFEVTSGGEKTEETLPLALEPQLGGNLNQGPLEHTKIDVGREAITTPLGTFECARIRRMRSMNDAGGENVEWRAVGFPVAIKTYSKWGHKQQEDIETRTVVRFPQREAKQ